MKTPQRSATRRRPRPLQTLIIAHPQDAALKIVVRRWAEGEAQACRRCDRCRAEPGGDDRTMCAIAVRGDITPEQAEDLGRRDRARLRVIA